MFKISLKVVPYFFFSFSLQFLFLSLPFLSSPLLSFPFLLLSSSFPFLFPSFSLLLTFLSFPLLSSPLLSFPFLSDILYHLPMSHIEKEVFALRVNEI